MLIRIEPQLLFTFVCDIPAIVGADWQTKMTVLRVHNALSKGLVGRDHAFKNRPNGSSADREISRRPASIAIAVVNIKQSVITFKG